MGLTFRRTIRVLPGVRVNLSSRGVGVSGGTSRGRYSSRSGPQIALPGGFTWRGRR